MEYRYYIYKQSLVPTNFNKYDLGQYDYLCEITNNSQWALNIERDAEWFTVIRKEFNGQISVSGADFNALIAIEGEPYQYAIVIHRKCGGAYSEFWKGFFSYFDFKVDMDRCTLSFEPQLWDAYSPVFDQMEIERNVLAADTPTSVFMDYYEYPIEELIYTYQETGSAGLPTWAEYGYNPTSYPPGNKFYTYQREITILYYDEFNSYYVYDVVLTFRREYYINNGTNPGGSWVLDPCLPGPGEITPGLQYKWVRPYLDIPNLPTGAAVFTCYGFGGYNVCTLSNSTTSAANINGGIYLKSILQYYADIFNMDYESSFFNDDPCPMGGATLEKTMLNHISNLRGVSEVATKGMMKLKDLLTMIRDTFNAYWFIDSNGDFRIEHRRYFDFGLDYNPLIFPTIELDLTTLYPDEVKHLRQYEWATPELYKYERLEMAWIYMIDWTDAIIEYPQLSINNPDYKTKSVQWSSDIIGMIDNVEDLPKKGWVLMDIELRGGGLLIPYVRNASGSLSGSLVPNARFSPANIYTNWWTYGRLLPYGLANGKNTQFYIEKLRQQEELTFPMCCQDIDFNGVFRTPLGDGIIDKAEYEAKTGNLKINLIYE